MCDNLQTTIFPLNIKSCSQTTSMYFSYFMEFLTRTWSLWKEAAKYVQDQAPFYISYLVQLSPKLPSIYYLPITNLSIGGIIDHIMFSLCMSDMKEYWRFKYEHLIHTRLFFLFYTYQQCQLTLNPNFDIFLSSTIFINLFK